MLLLICRANFIVPAGAKVPDSTAIVLYHFNDVWAIGEEEKEGERTVSI